MSAKQNRKRARRARQRAELLSLRAELVLLYDGEPIPLHFLNASRMETREYVRIKRYYDQTPSWLKPQWFNARMPYTGRSIVQMQLDDAAAKLAADIDRQVIESLTLDKLRSSWYNTYQTDAIVSVD